MKYLYTVQSHIPADDPNFAFKKHWNDFVEATPQLGFSQIASTDRLMEVFYSRLCLHQTMAKKGVHLFWRDLTLNAKHRLTQLDQLPISISHTKKMSIAVVGDESALLSIGVDIEARSREISPAAIKFIENAEDINMSPVTKWCLKEATYKCLSHIPETIRLKDIIIRAHSAYHPQSNSTCLWETIPVQDHIIAICYQEKS